MTMDSNGMHAKNGPSMPVENGEHIKKDCPMDGRGMAEEGVNVRTEPNNNHYSD